MIALHRKQIDFLETRILNKIIALNGTLIVNLVVNGVGQKKAADCEGKLISRYHSLQSDGEDWPTNIQEEHAQIDFDDENTEEYLNLIDTNIQTGNCLKFRHSDFEALFQLLYKNSNLFKDAYDVLNASNFYIIGDARGKGSRLGSVFKNAKVHDLVIQDEDKYARQY